MDPDFFNREVVGCKKKRKEDMQLSIIKKVVK